MVEEWVLALVASPWVYGVMFVLVTVDGFFPPMPSESVVIALAALSIASGVPNLWLVLAVAAAGAFAGDQIAYALGRRAHLRSSRLLRARRVQRTLDRAEQALASRGASFIIGARYIPIGRVAVNMTAGAVSYPYARFAGLTAIAAVSWALYSTAIGVGAGAWLGERPVVAVLVGVVGGAAIGFAVDALLGLVQRRTRTGRSIATASAPRGVEPGPAVADPAQGTTAEIPVTAGSPGAVPGASAVVAPAVMAPAAAAMSPHGDPR